MRPIQLSVGSSSTPSPCSLDKASSALHLFHLAAFFMSIFDSFILLFAMSQRSDSSRILTEKVLYYNLETRCPNEQQGSKNFW